MRRWCYVLVVLFALLTVFGSRAIAQSPGAAGWGGTDGSQTLVRIDAVGGTMLAQRPFSGATLTLDAWLPDGSGLLTAAATGQQDLCPNGN